MLPSNWILTPAVIPLLPLIAGPLILALYAKPSLQRGVFAASVGGAALLGLSLLSGFGGEPLEVAFGEILGFGIIFRVDSLSLVFLSLFSALALGISVYSLGYSASERFPGRYFAFTAMTFAGALGVVVAGNFLTLLLFFELMTFSSYVLVIHRGDEATLRVGNTYLYLGVIAGLLVLLGIILLFDQTGEFGFTPSLASLAGARYLPHILALFTVGFGIKAGLVPLHLWMPGAYAVSPAPVNAVSSGLMIKTGIYGLTRLLVDTLGASGGELLAGSTLPGFGMLLIWTGILTMFFGAALAILQRTVLRTLAYSSVSQIGYIAMGLGVAVYLGSDGAMGFSGALYHVVNHSLFKTTLFLVAGAIYFAAGGLDRERLGGLGRQLPLLAGIFLIAALGLGGIPGFNGYASKTVLHHAIVEAYEHHHEGTLWLAEWIFTLTSALTLCYVTRLFKMIFWDEGPADREELKPLAITVRAPLVLLAGAITFFGLLPHLLIERVFIPLSSRMGYGEHAIDYVAHVDVWSGADLLSSGKVLLLAAVIYFALCRIDPNQIRFPRWMCVEQMHLPDFEMCVPPWLDPRRLRIPHPKIDITMPHWLHLENVTASIPDEDEAPSWLNIHTLVYRPIIWISLLLIVLPVAVERSLGRLYHILMGGQLWATMRKHLPVRSSEWDLRNLNLDALIVIGMITGLLLFLIFYFT